MVKIVAIALCCAMMQDVDNAEYKNWAQFKAGTWVKTQMVSEAGGNKTEMMTTTKLISVDADKAVVESTTDMKMMGQDIKGQPMKRDVPAKVKKGEPAKDAPKPEEGDEDVEVGGKKLKCHWTKTVSEAGGTTTTTTVWTNNDVPGTVVKMSMDGASKMESIVVEYKVEK